MKRYSVTLLGAKEDKPKDATIQPVGPLTPAKKPVQNWLIWTGVAVLAVVGISAVVLIRRRRR
ncbi:MAG: hypothetical protein ACP5QG_09270 [candidate division WOR-3 bacterium]